MDDILLMGNDIGMLVSIKVWLSSRFSIKYLGKVIYILGIHVYKDKVRRWIVLGTPTLGVPNARVFEFQNFFENKSRA